jgi:hypothetical protein
VISSEGFEIMQSTEIELTLDDIRLFTSGLVLDEEKDDELVTKLLETTVKVHMLRTAEEVKV